MARTPTTAANFVSAARVIGAITLLSRLLGLAREVVAAAAFGAGPVWSAFTVAFTVPNLFRKLLGEGAISAAFIPLYAKRLDADPADANRFAQGSVNLLVLLLLGVVVVGEFALLVAWLGGVERDDYRLAIGLTMVMLPYVVLVCGAAFLGGILNVHGRFAGPAAASVVLNLCLIAAVAGAWWALDLTNDAGRQRAVWWLAAAVVVSGGLQVAVLLPGLRASGFGFDLRAPALTGATRAMLLASLPVAASAAVLQISVLLDKGIAFVLAAPAGEGPSRWLPMATGAAARLNWAQFLYQFPLGVFAIALATAIFPQLSRDAAANGGRNDAFRNGLRRGVEAALYVGLPASAGLVLVSTDATRVLFERGQFTAFDTTLVAASVAVYSSAVWAFGVQQIVGRGYYALGDTRTPLRWAAVNLGLNLAVEIPLIWLLPRPYAEIGMAAGTLVSFTVQSLAMLWLLSRRLGGIGLRESVRPVTSMLLATVLMVAACLSLRLLPAWPDGPSQSASAARLIAVMAVGAGVYLAGKGRHESSRRRRPGRRLPTCSVENPKAVAPKADVVDDCLEQHLPARLVRPARQAVAQVTLHHRKTHSTCHRCP